MLISVHLPKTAGSSFLAAIEQHFGERLVQDYGDRPINRGTFTRNLHALQACLLNTGSKYRLRQTDCIHGHFMPLKYRYLNTPGNTRFVVWMRDPVERLASHYSYWMRDYNPIDAGNLHRRVVEEKWSLERFALAPEMQNMYSKFFWGFPLNRFDFVGITEFYATEIEQFSQRILGASLDNVEVNVNPQRIDHSYIDDSQFRQKIEAFHYADVMLYRRALELRKSRLSGLGPSLPSGR